MKLNFKIDRDKLIATAGGRVQIPKLKAKQEAFETLTGKPSELFVRGTLIENRETKFGLCQWDFRTDKKVKNIGRKYITIYVGQKYKGEEAKYNLKYKDRKFLTHKGGRLVPIVWTIKPLY